MEREPHPPPEIGRAAISVFFGPGFALGNRGQRLCGEQGANRNRLRRTAGPLLLFFSARGSRPETEVKGFAGNGARTATASGGRTGRYYRIFRPGIRARKPRSKALRGMEREPHPPAAIGRTAITGFFGPGFAPGNRGQRLCGEWSANRNRLRRSAGPLLPDFSARDFPLPPAFFPIRKPACGRQSWLADGLLSRIGKRLPTACRFSVFTFLTAVPWKSPARSR